MLCKEWEVVLLLGLALATAFFLWTMYNWLVLANANPSLALSRRVPVRLCRYLFVVLLALMVNLSQHITGTLLINGLLIVPAATAANLASNLRQMFWYCMVAKQDFSIGISGTIVVLSVILFALSAVCGRWLRRA